MYSQVAHNSLKKYLEVASVSSRSPPVSFDTRTRLEQQHRRSWSTFCVRMHQNRNVKCIRDFFQSYRWGEYFFFFFFLHDWLWPSSRLYSRLVNPADISPWTGMCTMRITRRNEAVVTIYSYTSSCLMWSTLTTRYSLLCREHEVLRT